ncbi:MAG: DUF6231 family protein [Gammaproteobacteria bacterium]
MIYHCDMLSALEASQPKSILVIGPDGDELFGAYLRNHPDVRYQRLGADFEKIGTRSDLAFMSNTLEHMDKHDGGMLISRLRDLYCNQLYVAATLQPDHWSSAELIALGLRPVKKYVQDDAELGLFRYDLHDYKITPDWLNNRNWANPDLWNKFRW